MHYRPYEPLNTSTADWFKICPLEIPIDILSPSQDTLYEGPLPEGHSFCGDPYPHVVFYKGKHWISDGHNRINRAKLKGDSTIFVRLRFKL